MSGFARALFGSSSAAADSTPAASAAPVVDTPQIETTVSSVLPSAVPVEDKPVVEDASDSDTPVETKVVENTPVETGKNAPAPAPVTETPVENKTTEPTQPVFNAFMTTSATTADGKTIQETKNFESIDEMMAYLKEKSETCPCPNCTKAREARTRTAATAPDVSPAQGTTAAPAPAPAPTTAKKSVTPAELSKVINEGFDLLRKIISTCTCPKCTEARKVTSTTTTPAPAAPTDPEQKQTPAPTDPPTQNPNLGRSLRSLFGLPEKTQTTPAQDAPATEQKVDKKPDLSRTIQSFLDLAGQKQYTFATAPTFADANKRINIDQVLTNLLAPCDDPNCRNCKPVQTTQTSQPRSNAKRSITFDDILADDDFPDLEDSSDSGAGDDYDYDGYPMAGMANTAQKLRDEIYAAQERAREHKTQDRKMTLNTTVGLDKMNPVVPLFLNGWAIVNSAPVAGMNNEFMALQTSRFRSLSQLAKTDVPLIDWEMVEFAAMSKSFGHVASVYFPAGSVVYNLKSVPTETQIHGSIMAKYLECRIAEYFGLNKTWREHIVFKPDGFDLFM